MENSFYLGWEAVQSESGLSLQERIASKEMRDQIEVIGYSSEYIRVSEAVYGFLITNH